MATRDYTKSGASIVSNKESFSDLDPLFKVFYKDTKKPTFGNVVWRLEDEYNDQHIGDHLYIAKTELVYKAYTEFLYLAYNQIKSGLEGEKQCEVTLAKLFNYVMGENLNSSKFGFVNVEDLGDWEVRVKRIVYNNSTTLKTLEKNGHLVLKYF